MKQSIILLFVVVTIAGCKKTTVTNNKAAAGLSGMYVSFKSVDTTYTNDIVSQGIEDITVETAYGDTVYQHPGTPNYKISPNIIQNYSPSWVTSDTLTFTSATAGRVREPNTNYPFTYSIQTGYFNVGQAADVHYKLVQVDATTVEWISYQGDDVTRSDVNALYYRKK